MNFAQVRTNKLVTHRKGYQQRLATRWALLLIAPTVIGLFILDFWPIIQTFILSFCRDQGFGNYVPIGWENYKRLFQDAVVWQALLNTLIYTAIVVFFGVSLSLLLAVLLDKNLKGRGVFRTLYFLPMMAAPAAIALAWSWIFNSEYGVLNALLSIFGIEPIRWLTDRHFMIITLSIVTIWSEIGYNAIIILSGLQGIDKTYYEAAELDGAGPVKKFFKVTLPMISPTLFFVIITRVIFTLKQFDFSWMLFDIGNPYRQFGQTIMHVYYSTAFVSDNKGYASAICVIMLIVILVITAVQNKFESKWVNYDA